MRLNIFSFIFGIFNLFLQMPVFFAHFISVGIIFCLLTLNVFNVKAIRSLSAPPGCKYFFSVCFLPVS